MVKSVESGTELVAFLVPEVNQEVDGRDYKLLVNTIIIVAHQLLLLPAIQLLRQTLFKR